MPKIHVELGRQSVISFSAFGCIPVFVAIGEMYYGKGFLLTLLWFTLSFEVEQGMGNTLEFKGFVCLDEVLKNA